MLQRCKAQIHELTKEQPAAPLLLLTAASVFLHFVLAFLCAAACTVWLFARGMRKKEFRHPDFLAAAFFTLFVLATALISGNFPGAAAGAAIGCVLFTGLLFGKIMTPRLFEAALDTVCATSFFAAAVAFVQKCIPIWDFAVNRPESTFVNTNYYAGALALVILIAVYKLLFTKGGRIFYSVTVVLNVLMMYLTLCRSSWAPVGVGVLALLLFARRFKLFVVFLVIALAVAYLSVGRHLILPRMDDLQTSAYSVRKELWDGAAGLISRRPFTGFGPLGYFFASGAGLVPVKEWHAHNLLLEMLVSWPGATSFLM